jgi:hypothetical protein
VAKVSGRSPTGRAAAPSEPSRSVSGKADIPNADHAEIWRAKQTFWRKAAEALGWKFEAAYNGYVRADYHPNGPASEWASYPSEIDAEEACFIDGYESLGDAVKLALEAEDQHGESAYFDAMAPLWCADKGARA